MKSNFTNNSLLILCIVCALSACALSQADDKVSTPKVQFDSEQSMQQRTIPIDWESAIADASDNANRNNDAQLQTNAALQSPVPLLLPPVSITLSDAFPVFQNFSPAKIITDKRGYSAVVQGDSFAILIDASNQTFVTEQHNGVSVQANFDGDYQQLATGGQITIGRYGALYAIQLLCSQAALKNCITERMVREVIESLSVVQSRP